MTDYLKKSFTVSQRGTSEPATCEHGMVRPKDGSCCFCGAPKAEVAEWHALKNPTLGTFAFQHIPKAPPDVLRCMHFRPLIECTDERCQGMVRRFTLGG